MKVYVIRHGQSENNLNGKWTGWFDAPLTEGGIADAKKAGELLKGITFDKVFSSDLTRAYDTAKTALPDHTPEKSELLREIDLGTLANKPLDILTDEQRARTATDGYVEFGGESRDEFFARVTAFKNRLETLDLQNVAIFSHGGWLRTMLDAVLETKISGKHVCCNNCTVAIFEYTGGVWRLYSWINM